MAHSMLHPAITSNHAIVCPASHAHSPVPLHRAACHQTYAHEIPAVFSRITAVKPAVLTQVLRVPRDSDGSVSSLPASLTAHDRALFVLGTALVCYRGSGSCQAARKELILLSNLVNNVAASLPDDTQLQLLTERAQAVEAGLASAIRTICSCIATCSDSCSPPTNLLTALTQLLQLKSSSSKLVKRLGATSKEIPGAVRDGVSWILLGTDRFPGAATTLEVPMCHINDLLDSCSNEYTLALYDHLWSIASNTMSPARGWYASNVMDAAVIMLASLGQESSPATAKSANSTAANELATSSSSQNPRAIIHGKLPMASACGLLDRIHCDSFQAAGLILYSQYRASQLEHETDKNGAAELVLKFSIQKWSDRQAAVRLLQAVLAHNRLCKTSNEPAASFVCSQIWFEGVCEAAFCFPSVSPQQTTEATASKSELNLIYKYQAVKQQEACSEEDEAKLIVALLFALLELKANTMLQVPADLMQRFDAAMAKAWPAVVAYAEHALPVNDERGLQGTAPTEVHISDMLLTALDNKHNTTAIAHVQGISNEFKNYLKTVWFVHQPGISSNSKGVEKQEVATNTIKKLHAAAAVLKARSELSETPPSQPLLDAAVGSVLVMVDGIMLPDSVPAGLPETDVSATTAGTQHGTACLLGPQYANASMLQALDALMMMIQQNVSSHDQDTDISSTVESLLSRLFVCVTCLPSQAWSDRVFLTETFPPVILMACGRLQQRPESVMADHYLCSVKALLESDTKQQPAVNELTNILQAAAAVPDYLWPEGWSTVVDQALTRALQGAVRAGFLYRSRWATLLTLLSTCKLRVPVFADALLQQTTQNPSLFGFGLEVQDVLIMLRVIA